MRVNELRTQDLMEVLLISRTALECAKSDELLSQVLPQLEHIFKTGSLNFFYARRNRQELNLDRAVGRGIEDKFFTQFREYYHQLDPFFKIWLANPCATIITDQLAPLKDLSLSEYYNDFFRPQSIHRQMSIYLKSKGRLLGVFSLFRPRNAPDFSSLEQAKADLIASYLTSSLEKALILETMAERDSIFDSMVTGLPHKGVIVLDASLEPIYQNESAVSIMSNLNQAEGGREKSFEPLQEEIHLRCKDFLRSARLDETFLPHQHQFDFISPVDNLKTSIHLRLITYRDKSPLLLLCLDPEEYILCLFKRLRERGLTRREIDVVSLLSKGLTNKEIGEKLFISEYTVENHQRSIYKKMDVNNRTSVAHRLLQMALTN